MKLIANAKTDEETSKLINEIFNRLKLEREMKSITPLTNNEKIKIMFEEAKRYADGDLEKEIDSVFSKRK